MAAAAFAWVAVCVGCDSPPVVQPIPFNHLIHKQNDVKCIDCHEHAEDGARASISRPSDCLTCHDADITENPAAKPYIEQIRRAAKDGAEIPWVRLYELPAHVYFSHRRHTAIAGLDCAACHGDIGQRPKPAPYPAGRTLDMDDCMDCHEERGVMNDCAWCHR